MKPIKQQLFAEPLSPESIKLAQAIYFTCKENGDWHLEVKLQTLAKILHTTTRLQTIKKTNELLEELNEPLAVKDFKFLSKTYPLRFIRFCTYSWQNDKLIIELSEEYLHAHDNYMLEPFLY